MELCQLPPFAKLGRHALLQALQLSSAWSTVRPVRREIVPNAGTGCGLALAALGTSDTAHYAPLESGR